MMKGKYPISLPSKKYKDWHKQAWLQVISQKKKMLIDSCSIVLYFYAPDKRKTDLTNKAESVMDLLVDMGILKDDNWFIVGDLRMIFKGVDRENPRVEIEINETDPPKIEK